MQFNPNTDYNSIVKNIQDLTDTNLSKYTLKQITRSVNNYLNRASHILLEFSDKKNWDDPNFSTLPQGTYDISAGERQITVAKDEDSKEILKIRKVILKHPRQENYWQELHPIDLTSNDYVLDDRTTGVPYGYDWVGQTLIWDVIPNYDQSAGVKIFYERAIDFFNEADTTKEPGLPEHFHDYLVYGASYDYAMRKGLQRKDEIYRILKSIEQDMKSFLGNQSIEKNTRLKAHKVNVH